MRLLTLRATWRDSRFVCSKTGTGAVMSRYESRVLMVGMRRREEARPRENLNMRGSWSNISQILSRSLEYVNYQRRKDLGLAGGRNGCRL